jgi:hypothetical protein
MAKSKDSGLALPVRTLGERKGVMTGKPRKIMAGSMRSKVAFPMSGSSITGSGGNWYSPELSTDFLELPQSIDEQRNFYRFFYDHDPFVGQAIDLVGELPLSKVRLRMPDARNRKIAEASLRFCEKWSDNIGLLQRLLEIVHEWNLLGEVFLFCEDASEEMPRDITHETYREITAEGKIVEEERRREDADKRAYKWLRKNYKGWSALRILPPEQIHMESFPFTDEKLIELVPDAKTRGIIGRAQAGDERAIRVVESMPADIVHHILEGSNIPLNTDPDAGSFVHYMARKKSQYEPRGKSLLQRCLLPGTPIWIERDGVVQEVPVEAVDDRTDRLLTHKGRFQPCVAGSRPVDENIVSLTIEGLENPLRLTADHEVLRVSEDGSTDWIPAGNLRPGDLVREAHVVPEGGPLLEIDLATWWSGRVFETTKRARPRLGLPEMNRSVRVMKAEETDEGLKVTFEYDNDNRNRARATTGLSTLLRWAEGLQEPVIRTQAEVAMEAGLTERDVRVYAPRLRKEGLIRTESRSKGRGKGRQVTWFPAEKTDLPPVTNTLTSPVMKIPVTEDFCYLLGTWLGDGCLWTDSNFLNANSIGWSLHDTETATRVVSLVNSTLPGVQGVATGCLKDPSVESGDIRVKDSLLARWFQEEFGHTAQGKHLPRWVFNLPDEHIKALLRGLLDTDGWVKKGRYPRIVISLDNKVLLDQVHLLCNRLGWATKVEKTLNRAHTWTRSWQTKGGSRSKTYSYPDKWFTKITCSRFEDVREWACLSLKGKAVPWAELAGRGLDTRRGPKTVGGWIVRRVSCVEAESYQGVVHSFGVSGDESHACGVVTHNCLRTLVFRDKVRQSLTAIASRHMTPYRVVSAENMNEEQTENLREQVDLALQDPDYSIVTNFQVTWEEMGADQRLPDWSWVWDFTDRLMSAGLGVTETLLTGESVYSGDRIHLEVINTRFMLLREIIQDLVERYIFRPMCKRMGFIEKDEDGEDRVVVPRLSFTRLALRDNSETFDALFNLYQKGSLDIDIILELLNIDPLETRKKLERDFGTLQDATFNEILRGLYSSAGSSLAETTDFVELVAKRLGLKYSKPKEEGSGRF